MTKIKAIIFDLDGTLIDSVTDLANSVNYTLEKLALPLHTNDEIKSFVGDGVQKLLKRSLSQTHMDRFDDAFAIFMDHYGAHCTDSTTLYPGVAGTLPKLADVYTLAVLTNKSVKFSVKILTALEVIFFFNDVLGGDSMPTKKPDPAGIFYLANKWGLAPDQLVMVGDHVTDIEVGHRAGCKTVFIEAGIGETRGMAPDFIIQSMAELPALLESF